MLRKLPFVLKFLQVHFRCRGLEAAEMLSNLSLPADNVFSSLCYAWCLD